MAVSRLEARSGKRSRRLRKRRGEPYPIEKTRSGGAMKSKRKGASFEKQIAKLYAAYFGCSVRRTPGSGAWATVGSFGPKGDLVFASRKAPYHVECKKHEGWDLADLLTGKRSLATTSTNSLDKWWAQTIRDCPRKKIPMLVFARNVVKTKRGRNVGVPPLLMMRHVDFLKLGTVYKNGVALWCATDFVPHFMIDSEDTMRTICLLSDFFRFVKPPKGSPRRKQWKRGVG